MSTRKVTVVSTKTNVIKNYETEATTWGELVETIQRDFDLSKLKANENINKTTLEHTDAKLPEGPFRVFLRPTKTRSGNTDFSKMGFKEMRENFVKTRKEIQPFLSSKFSKNWTQLKTTELREGLAEYHKNVKSSVPVIEETANVVEEQPVQNTELAVRELTTDEKIATAFALLRDVDITYSESFQDLDEDTQGEAEVFFEELLANIDSLDFIPTGDVSGTPVTLAPAVVEEVESAEDKAAREAKEEEVRLEAERKEAERLENEAILKEAKEFGEGLI